MYVSNDSYVSQTRALSNTGKSSDISLPNFNDVNVYSKKESGTSDSEYKEAIIEQAIKDQAAGKFQNDSQGFNQLEKSYVSEVSPDRKNIITSGMQQITKDNTLKPLDYIALLLNGEMKYQKDGNTVNYAEFTDSNGETIATYSNNGWTMFPTKAEVSRQIEMCSIYNEAWNAAAKASQSSSNGASQTSAENSENTIDMLA